jgi:hypothetical protein
MEFIADYTDTESIIIELLENLPVSTPDLLEPAFNKKCWKTDPNAYARNYYHIQNKTMLICQCGRSVKKLVMSKHLKSKNHAKYVAKYPPKEIIDDIEIA